MHLGAVRAEELRALAAHPLGQGQDELVATRGADHRQGDARVAAGGLDDHALPALDPALALGGVQHRDADPILYGAAWVHVLELCQDLGPVG